MLQQESKTEKQNLIDLSIFIDNLTLRDGIWCSDKIGEISYPSDGHLNNFQVEEKSFWFNHRNKCIVNLVKKYSENEIFFDIGGGNGYTTFALQENNIKSVLIEPGINGIMNAKKRGVKVIVYSSFEELCIKSGSLKAIGLFDVLEHIKDDKTFMQKIYETMAVRGKIYITVPAYNWLWSKDDEIAQHFRRYTLRSLKKILISAGFRIIYQTYIFSFLPLPIFVLRTVPSRLALRNHKSSLNEHGTRIKPLSNFLDMLLNFEVECIKRHRIIPFGSSCLVVAEKTL